MATTALIAEFLISGLIIVTTIFFAILSILGVRDLERYFTAFFPQQRLPFSYLEFDLRNHLMLGGGQKKIATRSIGFCNMALNL
jgi:hypothetical protein